MRTDTYPAIPKTPPPRRRGWSGFQKFVLFILIAGVAAVFGSIAYLSYTEGKIDRIAAEDIESLSPIQAIGDTEMVNFLVVGTDDRENLPGDWEDYFGDFSGRRTDVIMLAHMVPGERIQLLSIPRDLKVDIPGGGTNRINAAYVIGGPDLLVEVVQNETGVPINHYVEMDFTEGWGEIVKDFLR